MKQPLILSTSSYQYLVDALQQVNPLNLLEVERFVFPDGEKYHRLMQSVRDEDVCIIGGTENDAATMELFDLACGAYQWGAQSLTLCIPYFGYSTMERATKDGELVKARNRAMLLSSIPIAPLGNRIYLFDLHSEGIPYYFDAAVQTTHVYTKPLLRTIISEQFSQEIVLASTDAGRAKWISSLSQDLGVPSAFAFKTRESGTETKLMGISGDIMGKTVVIYDDMIRTGGSLLQAAESYLNAGARDVHALATHAVLTQAQLDKLMQEGVISTLHLLDTHPNSQLLQHSQVFIHSIVSQLSNLINHHYVY